MGAAEGTEKGLGPFTYPGPCRSISREGVGPALCGQAGAHHVCIPLVAQPLYCCW